MLRELAYDTKKGSGLTVTFGGHGFHMTIPVTKVEAYLHSLVKSGLYAEPGGSFVDPLGLTTTKYDVLHMVHGGKQYCIRTDKIGHFFQQGYMLWNISTRQPWWAKRPGVGTKVAHTFSLWTEGLPLGDLAKVKTG